jgi:hypothetical protein
MSVRDTFGLPRDPANALHIPEGEWEYMSVGIDDQVPLGWVIVSVCGERVLLKRTHRERCGCGLEVGHELRASDS